MKFDQQELIGELISISKNNGKAVSQFKNLTEQLLNMKENSKSWSILECIEHLNLYFDFYIPAIRDSLLKNKNSKAHVSYKAGLLGNYFSNSMMVSTNMKKMKSPKDKDPMSSHVSKACLHKFLTYNNELLEMLDQSRLINLTKAKTPVSISKWIKLRLGDTLRIIVYHNERHIAQAQKIVSSRLRI